MAAYKLHTGNCVEALAQYPDDVFDSVVTDPPYELGFMGKGWDSSGIAYDSAMWAEVLRVLKPGGYVLAFGGTRTYHRMAVAIEDAGFEIRDSINWLYGSGFPKSLNVGKAIDKAAGAEREDTGRVLSVTGNRSQPSSAIGNHGLGAVGAGPQVHMETLPATAEAAAWEGWGTALKPAHEPVVVARKPLMGTVAANVLEYGTGALNIDGCRISTDDRFGGGAKGTSGFVDGYAHDGWTSGNTLGRWPANLILTHHHECRQTGTTEETVTVNRYTPGHDMTSFHGSRAGEEYVSSERKTSSAVWECHPECPVAVMDAQTENAARYFQQTEWDDTLDGPSFYYTAKANKKERNAGVPDGNKHPTVKPVAIMRYLIRLVTPPDSVVLDPFVGSGTTGIAAVQLGFDFVGIDITPEYVELAERRINNATNL